jgi:hypothetical protein
MPICKETRFLAWQSSKATILLAIGTKHRKEALIPNDFIALLPDSKFLNNSTILGNIFLLQILQ